MVPIESPLIWFIADSALRKTGFDKQTIPKPSDSMSAFFALKYQFLLDAFKKIPHRSKKVAH